MRSTGVWVAALTFVWVSSGTGAAAGDLPATTCLGEEVTILGTAGDDFLVGTPERDVIPGLDGTTRSGPLAVTI